MLQSSLHIEQHRRVLVGHISQEDRDEQTLRVFPRHAVLYAYMQFGHWYALYVLYALLVLHVLFVVNHMA